MHHLEQDVERSPLESAIPLDLAVLWAIVRRWHARITQRGHLAQLDARLLDDIGVTSEQAQAEIGKPFWL